MIFDNNLENKTGSETGGFYYYDRQLQPLSEILLCGPEAWRDGCDGAGDAAQDASLLV